MSENKVGCKPHTLVGLRTWDWGGIVYIFLIPGKFCYCKEHFVLQKTSSASLSKWRHWFSSGRGWWRPSAGGELATEAQHLNSFKRDNPHPKCPSQNSPRTPPPGHLPPPHTAGHASPARPQNPPGHRHALQTPRLSLRGCVSSFTPTEVSSRPVSVGCVAVTTSQRASPGSQTPQKPQTGPNRVGGAARALSHAAARAAALSAPPLEPSQHLC